MVKIAFPVLAAVAFAGSANGAAAQSVVYSNNFDANVAFGASLNATTSSDDFSQFETATTGSWNASGWNGLFAVNRSGGNPAAFNTISIGGLQANSQVTIDSMVVGFLESWDSSNGSVAPDYLDVVINGALVTQLTTNNTSGSVEFYAGGTRIAYRDQVNNENFGFSDTLVDLSTATFANSFADASGNWSIAFRASGNGWQGGGDEAWGIDNIRILGIEAGAGAVPEPSAWALLILGFGLVGGAMRRRTALAFA